MNDCLHWRRWEQIANDAHPSANQCMFAVRPACAKNAGGRRGSHLSDGHPWEATNAMKLPGPSVILPNEKNPSNVCYVTG